MTFLTPLLALGAAAVAVPALVILYFLKLRRREVEVSTTLLWKRAIEDLQANAPFQRLRRNILLLLQLLALGAALLALAQPQWADEVGTGVKHVILIDRSASMQARDAGAEGGAEGVGSGAVARTRLEAAKARAREIIDALREPGWLSLAGGSGGGDEAMVIAFDAQAEVRQNFTTSKVALRAAVEAIEAVDTPTRVGEALKLAKAYAPRTVVEDRGLVAAGGPPARIHILSDGRLPDASTATDRAADAAFEITPDDDVVYHQFGSPQAWNVGIVALRAERAFDDPDRLSVFVGVQSTAPEPKKVDVQISFDGAVAGVGEVSLPAAARPNADAGPAPRTGGAAGPEAGAAGPALAGRTPVVSGVVLPIQRSVGGVISVRLIAPGGEADALAVDDLGYLSIPPAKRAAVALIEGKNPWIRDALEGLSLARFDVFSAAQAQGLFDRGELARYDLVVMDGFVPEVARAEGPRGPGLGAGRFLVFGVSPPPPMGLIDEGPGDPGVIVDQRRDHPVMRGVGLDAVLINPARQTRLADSTRAVTLAATPSGPAIVEVSDSATRAIIVTFDVGRSTWPLDPGFVLFIASSLRYLTNEGPAAGEVLRPGGTITERLPGGAGGAGAGGGAGGGGRLRDPAVGLPDGTRVSLTATEDGRVIYGPLRRVGLYTVSWEGPAGARDVEVDGRARRVVAANLLDGEESDIAAASSIPLASRTVEAARAGSTAGLRRLWPYCLLAVLAVLMVEWWVYNRKVSL